MSGREAAGMGGGGGIENPKQAPFCQHGAHPGARTHEL